MKKIALTLVAVVLAVTSIFCFVGCGESSEQKLASYIESDSFQKQLNSMKSSYDSMMDIDVKAEGQNVVYTFTYKTDIPQDSMDTVKSTLENAFESLSSTYEGIANQLKEDAGIDDPSVVIEINAKDGTNIFSKTYKATK